MTNVPSGGGPGIIYLGADRWLRILANCKLIREMGCQWPIQVWFRPEDEVCEKAASELDIDLLVLNVEGDRSNDWTYAVDNTHLDQIVVLDADVYPTRAPCRLGPQIDKLTSGYWRSEDCELETTQLLINRDKYMVAKVLKSKHAIGKSTRVQDAYLYAIDGKLILVRVKDHNVSDALPMGKRLRQLLVELGLLSTCRTTTST